MQKRSSIQGPEDVNEIVWSVFQGLKGDNEAIKQKEPNGKNPAAVALGRLGGLKGGKARAEKLNSEERSNIARYAARSRWDKKG